MKTFTLKINNMKPYTYQELAELISQIQDSKDLDDVILLKVYQKLLKKEEEKILNQILNDVENA